MNEESNVSNIFKPSTTPKRIALNETTQKKAEIVKQPLVPKRANPGNTRRKNDVTYIIKYIQITQNDYPRIRRTIP